jgi:hypothetical protein
MKDIKGYEGLYAIDESGKIWAHPKHSWKGRFLKTWLVGHGYEMVMIYRDKKPKKFLVHRLIAQAFISNPKKLPEVNHKDGNIRNNLPENLEWVTSKENKTHAWDKGLYTHKGINHYLAKLDENKVRKIRKLLIKKISLNEAGRIFNVSAATIRDIHVGNTWKHVI